MYVPKIEDVQVTEWRQPAKGGKDVLQAVIYLNGGGADADKVDGNYHFGHYETAEIDHDASAEQHASLLEETVKRCVDNFDVAKAAVTNGYTGDLEYLRPLELAGHHDLDGRAK